MTINNWIIFSIRKIKGSTPGKTKLFFGTDEVFIPVYGKTSEAAAAYPNADIFINFASYRSAFASTMEALQIPSIRVVSRFTNFFY